MSHLSCTERFVWMGLAALLALGAERAYAESRLKLKVTTEPVSTAAFEESNANLLKAAAKVRPVPPPAGQAAPGNAGPQVSGGAAGGRNPSAPATSNTVKDSLKTFDE